MNNSLRVRFRLRPFGFSLSTLSLAAFVDLGYFLRTKVALSLSLSVSLFLRYPSRVDANVSVYSLSNAEGRGGSRRVAEGMRSGIRASSRRRARSFGRHTCCWLDVGSRPAPALASSRDRTDDEAPMSTIPKRARGLSSKRPYRRPVGTSRSTPRHRHRADGDGRRESWPNTRCRPIARPPRRRSQSKFRRHISIAAFCLTSATRSAAASPRSLCDETRRRIIVNYVSIGCESPISSRLDSNRESRSKRLSLPLTRSDSFCFRFRFTTLRWG